MSKVEPRNYWYDVCPHCKSKKLSPVGMVRFGKAEWTKEAQKVSRTGYLCGNCKRYILNHQIKHIYDCAEIKRDVKKLQTFLRKQSQKGR